MKAIKKQLTTNTRISDVSPDHTFAIFYDHELQNPISLAILAEIGRFELAVAVHSDISDVDLLPTFSVPGIIHDRSIFKHVVVDTPYRKFLRFRTH